MNSTQKYTEQGSFTHNDKEYDLEQALNFVVQQDIILIKVEELKWILEHMPPGYFDYPHEKQRTERSDLKAPILITHLTDDNKDNNIVVLDGIHRLKKALENSVFYNPKDEESEEMMNSLASLITINVKYRKVSNGKPVWHLDQIREIHSVLADWLENQ